MDAWLGPVALIVVAIINSMTLYYMRRLEKNTNSKMDQLVEVTKDAAFARGVKSETDKA